MTDIALDEKALAAPAGWLDISDEAVSGKRILLLWEPAGGLDEHVELGWFCQSAAVWVNTYGKPFSSAPDKWAPLAPFVSSSPSQVAPANPAQLTDAIPAETLRQLDVLFGRTTQGSWRTYQNGVHPVEVGGMGSGEDYAICTHGPKSFANADWIATMHDEWPGVRAALTAAIGAGGQAVAVKPTVNELFANCDRWGALEWFNRLAMAIHNRDKAVVEGDDLSFATYDNIGKSSASRLVHDFEQEVRSALSQPHPADERVVEALREIEYCLTKDSLCEAEKIDDALKVVRRLIATKEGRKNG